MHCTQHNRLCIFFCFQRYFVPQSHYMTFRSLYSREKIITIGILIILINIVIFKLHTGSITPTFFSMRNVCVCIKLKLKMGEKKFHKYNSVGFKSHSPQYIDYIKGFWNYQEAQLKGKVILLPYILLHIMRRAQRRDKTYQELYCKSQSYIRGKKNP